MTWTHGPRTFQQIAATGAALAALALLISCKRSVTTYHYDNLRTGWNSEETKLKPSNVASLNVLALVLDDANDQVDTQPLIVPGIKIAGGKHDAVYLATENDSVYAIDANTDTKLLKVSLGISVPWPIGCSNNGPTVGIDGTPAIDLASHTMYVIAYVLDNSAGNPPAYYIHALDLSTLTDKVPPQKITASHTLKDGSTFSFNATFQRQRPGLLLANGNVYAGFGSFCDWGALPTPQTGPASRGWILGWQAGTLTPLPTNAMNDTQTTEPNNMFLSSVWESGYGLANDPDGNIYFTTGNSDYSGTTYDGCTNIQESVVKLPPSLDRICPTIPPPSPNLFTPANVANLDQGDTDVGSAGVMALPPQAGSIPKLLVSNGKDGSMFLLNRDNLGGFTPSNAGVLGGVQSIGAGCWCGPTYFNDGAPHVVSSGGGWGVGVTTNSLQLWNLQTAPSPKLVQSATGAMPDTIQDPGFFTTVSSNGNKNAIIWAVSRPLTNSEFPIVWLYAVNATPSGSTLPQLFQAVAGSWPYLGGNANIVPVVANGKVYVASYRELEIFGLNLPNGLSPAPRKKALATLEKIEFYKGTEEHQVSGTLRKVDGTRLTLETRDHKMAEVDTAEAQERHRYAVAKLGSGVTAAGSYNSKGVLQAETVARAKAAAVAWPPDR